MMERRGLPMLNQVLQHTLRSLCSESQWVYAILWRILPRNYPPPKWENEGGAVDRSKGNKRNWILVWEDGFCDFPACSVGIDAHTGARFAKHAGLNHADESAETAMHPELFFKMSHEVYNYGEGLMGKVAADNSHKWVYREPAEHEFSFLSPWHGSLDPHPRTWEAQFKAGIQTIAVISVCEGLIQLGSTKKVVEDLNFVILMQRKFNYLQSIPGVFVPHPSSFPGATKRRDGASSSPPTDGSVWPGNKDQNQMPGLLTRPSSDPSYHRINPQAKQFGPGPGVLGIKRPPDNDYMMSVSGLSTTARDFPLLSSSSSPGLNFNGASRFDSRQHSGQAPDCPSPPKALNTGQCQKSISSLMPSNGPGMSSLHNLLSKLPSVTANEPSGPGPGNSSTPSGLTLPSASTSQFQSPQSTFPRQPISPSSSADSSLRGMTGACPAGSEEQNPSPRSISPPSRLHQQHLHQQHQHRLQMIRTGNLKVSVDSGAQISTSPGLDPERSDAGDARTADAQQNSATRSSELADSRSLRDHHFGHGPAAAGTAGTAGAAGIGAAAPRDKLTSFLDSFDQDTLTDFDLQDDLENSETYNSFLNEII